MPKGGREQKKPKKEAEKTNASQPSTKGTATAAVAGGKKGK